MTRADSSAPSDPFSAEAIVRCVQEAGRYTASELHERGKYLRVLGVLPIASATPPGAATNITRNHGSESRSVIESNPVSAQALGKPSELVQGAFRPATPEQREALATLKTLAEPFEVGDFADAHECSRKSAARWLCFFLAKGVIVRGDGRRGHFFAKAKTG